MGRSADRVGRRGAPLGARSPRAQFGPALTFAGLHQAPRFLPLLRPMEERAGERRRVFIGFPSPRSSPLVPRGERRESLMQPRALSLAAWLAGRETWSEVPG